MRTATAIAPATTTATTPATAIANRNNAHDRDCENCRFVSEHYHSAYATNICACWYHLSRMGVRLRTKFVIILVAITLVLSGSVYVAFESYKRDAVEEERGRVNETATLVADQIDESIRDRRDYVGLLASRSQARDFGQSNQFLDALIANSRFYAAQIVASNGTVVGFRGDITSESRESVIGANRSDTSYVQQALRGRTSVSNVVYANQTQKSLLVFSAPIFQGSEVKGALVASMYLDRQTVFDMLPPLETSSQTVEITGNGIVLSESNQTFDASVRSSSTVESTGWQVTVARDRTALDARLGRLAASQALVLGVVLAAMLGFGYWQYAVSLRQTERLLDGFTELGAGNYDHSVSLSGGTEWEQMSDGFNELAATLKARDAALRERQQRLEVLYRVLQHNLRNQMSVILNYADVITDLSADETIHDAAETILTAVQDVTSLSQRARQIENAIETDPDRKSLEVTALVSEVVADLREEYPHVDLNTSLPDAAWAIALPSLRLAVENVCRNACEHNDSSEPRVEIAVSSYEEAVSSYEENVSGERAGTTREQANAGRGQADATREQAGATHEQADTARGQADETRERGEDEAFDEEDGWVRITVADNGPGIPSQDRTAISEGRETELEHGSGLGLWLTYWIVDNSGGELKFTDNEPRGSVVHIDLPQGGPTDEEELTAAMHSQ
jgi:signal transduction histidine kinase